MPDNQPIPSTRGTDRHDRPLVHPVVARGGAYAWRLIGIGIVGWAALQLLTALWVLVLTGAVAVLLGRALDPVANVFRRRGLRPALVAVVTLGGFLLVMAGIMALLVPAIVDEFSDLGPTLEESIDDLEDWLVDDSPFDISRTDIREFRETAGDRVSETLESQGGTVVSGTVVAFEVITGLVLAMIATFFLLKDGDKFGRWLLTFMPDERRPLARRLAAKSWQTLGGYLRGSATLGVIEGIIIGFTVWIVGGALAVPVAVITFFAAFLPFAGAVLAGAVAVLVTLVSAGVTPAAIVLVVAVLVQQLDNDFLAPVVFGKNLELHPLVVLAVIVAGSTLFGAFGAVLAVPVTAVGDQRGGRVAGARPRERGGRHAPGRAPRHRRRRGRLICLCSPRPREGERCARRPSRSPSRSGGASARRSRCSTRLWPPSPPATSALNAFVHLDEDLARAGGRAPSTPRWPRGDDPGPLAGVPVRRQGPRGLRRHAHLARLAALQGPRRRSTDDSVHVARLRAAGAVPVGKTAAPEFGTLNFTKHQGVGHRPATRGTPSARPAARAAGRAAAVAAGLVPVATASDGGGLDPHPRGVLAVWSASSPATAASRTPARRLADRGASALLTTTVADTARHLDVVAGPDDRDRLSLPPPTVALRGGHRVARRRRACGPRWSPDLGFAELSTPRCASSPRRRPRALADAAGLELDDEPVAAHRPGAHVAVGAAPLDLWLVARARTCGPTCADDLTRYTRGGRSSRPRTTRCPSSPASLAAPRAAAGWTRPRSSPRSTCCSRPTTAVPAFAAEGPPPTRSTASEVRPAHGHAVHDARQPVLEPGDRRCRPA